MSNRRLVPLNVVSLPTAPTGTSTAGDIYHNSTDGNLYVSDGTTWVSLGGADGPYNSSNFATDFSARTTDDLSEGSERLYFTVQRARSATSGIYDPAGSADAAEQAAKSYADALGDNYDPAGSAAAAQSAAQAYADSLAPNYDPAGSAAAAEASARSYTDQELSSYTALPPQSGQSGKYLTTDGSSPSWVPIETVGSAGSLQSSYSTPTSPEIGSIYFDRSLNAVRVYDGSGWGVIGFGSGTIIGGTGEGSFTGSYDGGFGGTEFTATAPVEGGFAASFAS